MNRVRVVPLSPELIAAEPIVKQIAGGWLVLGGTRQIGHRIGCSGDTREAALANFAKRLEWWLAFKAEMAEETV